MFEVYPQGNGYAWALIAPCGRRLVWGPETYPCTFSAADGARAYRIQFQRTAWPVDHRMGACI